MAALPDLEALVATHLLPFFRIGAMLPVDLTPQRC